MSRPPKSPRYAPGSRVGAGGRPRIDPAGPTVRVELRLTPTAAEQLDALALARGESRSAVVRWAIQRAWERACARTVRAAREDGS